MASPTYNNKVSSAISDGGATTITTSAFTPGGTNRALLAFVFSSDNTPANLTAVKIGGSGGTSLIQLGSYQNVGVNYRSSLWGLASEPANSSQTMYAQWAASQGERGIIALSFADVDQTTRFGTATQTNNVGITLSLGSIGAAVGDLVADFGFAADGGSISGITFTANSGQTEREDISTSPTAYDAACAGTLVAASASETRAWSASATPSDGWTMHAVAIKQMAAAGGFLNRNYWWDNL